jgi:hydroxymethylpyrimidine/phosphomethylpyrimidine kinase
MRKAGIGLRICGIGWRRRFRKNEFLIEVTHRCSIPPSRFFASFAVKESYREGREETRRKRDMGRIGPMSPIAFFGGEQCITLFFESKQEHSMTYIPPCVLTIAGSDSSGGAGIQADLKTMTVLGCYGASVITALTAQNTVGVHGIFAPEPEFVAAQLGAVLDDLPVKAAKTGMLFSAPIIDALIPLLEEADFPLVVDPVCVSQSGHTLLQEDAVEALRDRIIPLAALLTPNRPEAELLADMSIDTEDDVARAIQKLLAMGAGAVLLKGGHFEGDAMVDWLGLPGQKPMPVPHARVETRNTHGTGCTLSAAIASWLGRGADMEEAVRRGQAYLHLGLEKGYDIGKGDGPVNHLAPWLDAFA